uniref:Uncharacterized protein n=1 Tax=Magallana gigas TaxID=29159 RepID=A0A8W8JM56_MAGGI
MSKEEKDMYIMGSLVDSCKEKTKRGKKRIRSRQTFMFSGEKLVVQFISSYADDFGLQQPAAPRGRDDTPPIYIPSDTTKKDVHDKYVESCPNDRHVRYSTFCNIRNQCLPHIRIAKPRDDVYMCHL